MSDGRGYARLNEAFQYVSDEFLDIVEQEKVRRKKKPVWVIFAAAAACICVLVVLPAGVMAYNWFGIRDLLLSNEEQQASFISLSGYRGSPEAKALEEWEEFQSNYDKDIGNDIFIEEGREDWFCYRVYSHEMGEKLDEIAAKYGLKLHTEENVVSAEELEKRVGGVFLGEECNKDWGYGYIYENGTFQWSVQAELENCGMVDFQLRRTVKGTMDEVLLNIGQADDYVEWQYAAACGEPVLLALSGTKALVFADYEDCFIAVNVLQGSIDGITREDLQELADKIDFTILKEVRAPQMYGDSIPDPSFTETVAVGEIGNLGVGRLFYVMSIREDEDYKLYFFKTEDTEWLFEVSDYPLAEADYVFPDVREDNTAIGMFWQIYYYDIADITGDGLLDFIIVARYKAGEEFHYDMRIYEWGESGYLPNMELMEEMNRKYYNAEVYPVDELMALPHEQSGGAAETGEAEEFT